MVGIRFYPPKPHRSRGTEIDFWTPCDIPTKDAYDVLTYSPPGDSPFCCFGLNNVWEIEFSRTKGEYNEYNCILANFVREVLKYVSGFMGLRDTHLAPNTVGGFGGC